MTSSVSVGYGYNVHAWGHRIVLVFASLDVVTATW